MKYPDMFLFPVRKQTHLINLDDNDEHDSAAGERVDVTMHATSTTASRPRVKTLRATAARRTYTAMAVIPWISYAEHEK
jgi:hypothetical protein